MAAEHVGDEGIAVEHPGPHQPVDQRLRVVGARGLPALPSNRNVRREVSGSVTPPSSRSPVGAIRSETPTAKSIPVNTAPSGTGARPVRVSGPVTAAYAVPSCCQKTSPSRAPATDVMVVTRALVHVHTESTHGESDPRVSNCSPTSPEYA